MVNRNYVYSMSNDSRNKVVRYSLEELMISKEIDLGKFKERVQTQTEFRCYQNNFLVLDDQCTVIGIDKKDTECKMFSSKDMI